MTYMETDRPIQTDRERQTYRVYTLVFVFQDYFLSFLIVLILLLFGFFPYGTELDLEVWTHKA